MSDEEKIEKAKAFATLKHKGQYRRGGAEYIVHPLSVAEKVKDKGTDYIITALFHDLLEDTDATEEEIEAIGGKTVLEAVKLLTKNKNEELGFYVERIRNNPLAFEVKKADRLDNLLSAVDADENFRRKYILQTIDYYWDFSKDIREATDKLRKTIAPLIELPLEYGEKGHIEEKHVVKEKEI